MSIGLQAQDAIANSGGLTTLGNSAGLTGQGISAVTTTQPNTPDNWVQYDLPNRDPNLTSWGQFNIDPNLDYANILKTAYTNPSLGTATNQYLSSSSMAGPQWENVNPMSGSAPYSTPWEAKPQTRTVYSGTPEATAWQASVDAKNKNPGITFKDANVQSAMDAINSSLQGGGDTVSASGTKKTPITYGNGWDVWNPASQDTLNSTAQKYGITYDDLLKDRGMYERAYKDIYDPVGANWTDLKNSPTYDKLLGGIRQFSGQPDSFYTDLNSKAGNKDNPYFLPAEYFALNDPNVARSGIGGANTQFYNNTGVMGKIGGNGFSDISGSNPYQRQDWQDYTLGTDPWWNQSADQQTQAKADMAHHNDLLSADPTAGGAFDLGKASGYTATYDKNSGGYHWKDSPTMNQYDIAQNMGGWNNIKDATTLDPNATLQSGLQYMAPKKKGKGALGILGTIANIASFIPGPWALPARLASAGLSAVNGNPIGALTSIAGANFGGASTIGNFGTGADGLANIGDGSILGNIGNSIGGVTGLGTGVGNAITSAGVGAINGAANGDGLVGGLSGLIGGSAGALGEAGMNPYLASAISGAGPMGIQYLNQEQKNKKALDAYKAKLGIA